MKADVSGGIARPGLLERLKHALSPDALVQRFNLTKSKLIEIGIYLIVGFIVGYLLKKYSKFVFAVALSVLVLIILHQLDLISITTNWTKIQDLLGMHPIEPAEDGVLLTIFWEWIKSNVGLVLSFLVGFLMGIRLG